MSRDVDDLKRPEGNDLLSNYELHDEAERAFLEQLPDHIDVEAVGIDKRHDDSGELIYDDAPDVRLWDGDEAVCCVDFKAKSSDKWMGWLNKRHFDKYVGWDEAVFLYFHNTSTDDGFMAKTLPSHERNSLDDEGIRPFPDRNEASYITEDGRTDVDSFILWTLL